MNDWHASTYLVGGPLNGKRLPLPTTAPRVMVEGNAYDLGLRGLNGFRYYDEAGSAQAPRMTPEPAAAAPRSAPPLDSGWSSVGPSAAPQAAAAPAPAVILSGWTTKPP